MFSGFQIIFWLLLTAGVAWLWHAQGMRERALVAVRRHCEHQGLTLLDDNVAFQKLRWTRNSQGRLCGIRTYGFEFTVTGEQRYSGSVTLLGNFVHSLHLAPHPFPQGQGEPGPEPASKTEVQSDRPKAQVIQLDEWRRQHAKASGQHPE